VDPSLQQLVWQRAGARCEYCQIPQELDEVPFEIDLIIARKHRGGTVAGNLALACFYCNSYKGPNLASIDRKTRKITRLYHPRRHTWHYHFRWGGPMLIGRTAIGRTTVALLEINLPARAALRASLIEEGQFPPA
jgi:hypothetical protein